MTDDELRRHINALDAQNKAKLSDHADAADHEDHPSFKAISKWLLGILGTPPAISLVWRAAKLARRQV